MAANSASKFFDEDFFQLFRVHVYHTGRVRWWYGGVMETSCHLDGTLFPFDSQSCSIVVQSWAHSEAFVDVRNASDVVHMEQFDDNGERVVQKTREQNRQEAQAAYTRYNRFYNRFVKPVL